MGRCTDYEPVAKHKRETRQNWLYLTPSPIYWNIHDVPWKNADPINAMVCTIVSHTITKTTAIHINPHVTIEFLVWAMGSGMQQQQHISRLEGWITTLPPSIATFVPAIHRCDQMPSNWNWQRETSFNKKASPFRRKHRNLRVHFLFYCRVFIVGL